MFVLLVFSTFIQFCLFMWDSSSTQITCAFVCVSARHVFQHNRFNTSQIIDVGSIFFRISCFFTPGLLLFWWYDYNVFLFISGFTFGWSKTEIRFLLLFFITCVISWFLLLLWKLFFWIETLHSSWLSLYCMMWWKSTFFRNEPEPKFSCEMEFTIKSKIKCCIISNIDSF